VIVPRFGGKSSRGLSKVGASFFSRIRYGESTPRNVTRLLCHLHKKTLSDVFPRLRNNRPIAPLRNRDSCLLTPYDDMLRRGLSTLPPKDGSMQLRPVTSKRSRPWLPCGSCCSPVLAHCRVDTLHARGCFVVDAILGKE
jgi:hypothetical protein